MVTVKNALTSASAKQPPLEAAKKLFITTVATTLAAA